MTDRTTNHPAAPILVTGGTGTLGHHVVERLRRAGRPVRVLSRSGVGHDPDLALVRGDLETGEGIDAAVRGAEVIVHLAGTMKGDEVKARNLVDAAARAGGIRHVVYISVVGADTMPVESAIDRATVGYFASKHAAERIIAESGFPWTILRATQFHDLALKTVAAMARMPVVPAPKGWRLQPVDPREVADRLVQLADGEPAGYVPAIGGPRIYAMTELVRSYLHVMAKRRPIVELPMPGKGAAAYRAGANLAPDRAVGRISWEEFLAERLSSPIDHRAAA
ncbi:MAG: NAD(P)H-binding protein [Chloroflexota bacterium]|nr:NAD(P)H-binding protein [Chloroflexota bacterium]